MRKRNLITVTVLSKNGRVLKVKCRRFDEMPDRYLAIKSEGWGIQSVVQFMKADWSLAPSTVVAAPKRGKKRLYDPNPEPVPPPAPEPAVEENPFEEPAPEPLVPKMEPEEDEFSDADMAIINNSSGLVARENPGDLTKELPGEYNNNIKHDTIGAEDLALMKAKVDSEFARQDGLRRVAQAKAKRQMMTRLEQAGVGILPDGTF